MFLACPLARVFSMFSPPAALLHAVRRVQANPGAAARRGPVRRLLLLGSGAVLPQEDAQLPSHGQATQVHLYR